MKTTAIALTLSLTLAACGGGGGPDEPQQQPAPRFSNLHVIGNSITASGLNPMWTDWTGPVRGMAASTPEKDFVHIVAAHFKLPMTLDGGVDIEIRPDTVTPGDFASKTAPITANTLAVIELGDNAPTDNLVAFSRAYDALLASTRGAKLLLCLGTWWGNTATDDAVKASCIKAGGTYVYIGGIYKGRLGIYQNEGVDRHPGDEGMAEIARRIVEAAR